MASENLENQNKRSQQLRKPKIKLPSPTIFASHSSPSSSSSSSSSFPYFPCCNSNSNPLSFQSPPSKSNKRRNISPFPPPETMQQLLFTVIFFQLALIMVLSFKTPFRKLVIMSLDRVKRGRGPVVVKTVAATVLVLLMSSLFSMVKIQKRRIDEGAFNPTDQVLMVKHLLEATLMGAILFLALMIDRLHHYIRELRIRRKSMEAVKRQNQSLEDGKAAVSEETRALEEEMTALKAKFKQLESELETKSKEVSAAEANAVALRKQSEGFLLEYDRLLEENQNLRSQLQSLDRKLSHSGSKKNS